MAIIILSASTWNASFSNNNEKDKVIDFFFKAGCNFQFKNNLQDGVDLKQHLASSTYRGPARLSSAFLQIWRNKLFANTPQLPPLSLEEYVRLCTYKQGDIGANCAVWTFLWTPPGARRETLTSHGRFYISTLKADIPKMNT